MRKLLFGASLFLLTIVLQAQGKAHFEEGVEFFKNRAEGCSGLVANPRNLSQAIYHFQKAFVDPIYERDAGVFLLKCAFYKGTFVETEKEKMIAAFAEGKKLGEYMVGKYPTWAAAQFWYLTCLGKWAECKSGWAAATDGVAEKMKIAAEKIIENDPTYHDASAFRVLGMLNIKCPYIPFFLPWPDDKEGLKKCEESVTRGPGNPGNFLSYAEALYENGLPEKAIGVLKRLIGIKPRPDMYLEDKKEIEDGKTLLEKYLKK